MSVERLIQMVIEQIEKLTEQSKREAAADALYMIFKICENDINLRNEMLKTNLASIGMYPEHYMQVVIHSSLIALHPHLESKLWKHREKGVIDEIWITYEY